MGHNRLLIQSQFSNYSPDGVFTLHCDSGFQMNCGRIREMLELNDELHIDMMVPRRDQVHTQPEDIVGDLVQKYGDRLKFVRSYVIPNAPVTRYDFDYLDVGEALEIASHKMLKNKKYDAVYVNDPMLLRHFRALFFLQGGYLPKFFVHSHFIDNPQCPKFPTEVSLWMGQCEAARKADYNFWQCGSAMDVFFKSMSSEYLPHIVAEVLAKSAPWDDGYSVKEITRNVDWHNCRFNKLQFLEKTSGKVIIFVPNRVGGKGRSSDYTNCGKFLFDIVPELWKKRRDFVVIAGNPSQKFTNEELERACPALVNLVPDALSRDEYRYVAHKSHVVVGLYNADAYGSTSSRECIELGCMPLWLDNYEYSLIAQAMGGYEWLAKTDFSDIIDVASSLIDVNKHVYVNFEYDERFAEIMNLKHRLKEVNRRRCSYESTTPDAMKIMGLL